MVHMLLIDNIARALGNGECVIGLHSDFSKAFDTVSYVILLDKLELDEIYRNALSWFKSYL